MHITGILKKHGPLASDELSSKLMAYRLATSEATARKQIQRATGRSEILSTYPVRFDKSYLYYLDSHKGKKYAEAIKKLLPQKPAFSRAFKMLLNNKGYITLGQIGKSSGAVPDGADYTTGKRDRLARVVERLQALGVIELVSGYAGIYKIGKGFGSTKVKLSSFTKLLALEQIFLEDFVKWAQNIYVIGDKSHEVRAGDIGIVNFNTTCWDYKAPMYLGPCTKSTEVYSKKRQIVAFCVMDIIGFRSFTEDDARALIERLKTVSLRWKKIRIFSLALALDYNRKALNLLRTNGIAPLTYKEVWGRDIQELLRLYRSILSGDIHQNLDSIEKALSISHSIDQKDGMFGCIKGDFFEVMTSLAYHSNGYDTTLQKKITSLSTGEDFEIDVVARKGDRECLLIECKGSRLSEEENEVQIKRHFEDRCRVASESYGWDITNHYNDVKAIYFTTDDKSSMPSKYSSKIKSYGITCHVTSREEVLELFNSADSRLAKLVQSYY